MEGNKDNQENKIDLAAYLFTRLYQVGVRSMQGVPGDYNLESLDYIKPAGLHWVGNANELNAGYAADGYARIKGISALVTAFGVGELSAVNAIAGSFAERAPVVHIVGTPATTAQKAGSILHHSLGDGNFRIFARVYQEFTCAQANLTDPVTAPDEIDRVIGECLKQHRPVYIELPTDLVTAKVSSSRLKQSIKIPLIENDKTQENEIVEKLYELFSNTKQPVFIVDGFAAQNNLLSESDTLIRLIGCPTYVTPFGKGLVNEVYSNFHGTYAGKIGDHIHANYINSSDLIARFGPLDADVNTYGFTTLTNRKATVDINSTSINIQGALYQNVNTKRLLSRLIESLEIPGKYLHLKAYPNLPSPRIDQLALPPPILSRNIDQKTLWLRLSAFLRPYDIILTESGTSSAGGKDLILPHKAILINSGIWISIGYTLAAAVGVALAQRDLAMEQRRPAGRTILFIGDGSFQMTAQSVSDVFRNRLDLTIFLINNSGYTIERHIHGMTAAYNDIHPWDYLDCADFFGAPKHDPSYPVFTERVTNWGELFGALASKQLKEGKGFNMVEVIMDEQDAPESLKGLIRLVCNKD